MVSQEGRRPYLAIGAGSLGVNNTLGNTLTVEVSQLIDKMKILQQYRPRSGAYTLPSGRIVHGTSIGGGVQGLLVVSISRLVVGAHNDLLCDKYLALQFSGKAPGEQGDG